MSISQLAGSIQESPTLRLNEEARLLREKGEPVIHLGGGEPKNKAPLTAIQSATARLESGDIKYGPTDGMPSLKKAIIQYTEENYGRKVAPQNVIVSTGAKQCVFNVLYSIVNPQEEVILLAPYWVSYPEMIKMVRGVPVVVHPSDGSFCPRLADIEQAVTPRTRAIIVNSPNNPSGAVFPAELIAAIVEFCERKEIYLIMDDIYHKLVFDGNRPEPGYRFTQKDVDDSQIIVVNGVSKLYGMTGFRIGWTVASRKLADVMATIQGQITSCASIVSQAAAEGALKGDQAVVEDLRLAIQHNRDLMLREFSVFPGVQVAKPGGTFYCLPDFSVYNKNSLELCGFLLRKALVVTVPGGEFGAEGHLRLSYAGSEKDVIEGVRRIRWALDPDSPDEIQIGDRKVVRDWA